MSQVGSTPIRSRQIISATLPFSETKLRSYFKRLQASVTLSELARVLLACYILPNIY